MNARQEEDRRRRSENMRATLEALVRTGREVQSTMGMLVLTLGEVGAAVRVLAERIAAARRA